jgi:ABC-type Fe3+ transport system permease subunit
MIVMRLVGWLTAALVAALVAVPLCALVPAAVLDRGPGGSARATVLYIALAAFDPFVWGCVWHSLTVAIVVASGSYAGGVALGRAVGRWRFWGRRPLAALAMAPLAVPPLFGAIGLRGLTARWGPLPGDAEIWLAWIWVGLASGVPLVALSARNALRRVDPVWEQAARLGGASPRQVWATVAWPLVRPDVSRAVAAVFTLTLLEPGAPLALGLRSTLAFQVVEAARGGSALAPRAASLALIACAIVALGRLLVRWWGRSPWPTPPVAFMPHPRQASWRRASVAALALAAWICVALWPAARLVGLAVVPAAASASTWGRLERLANLVRDDTEMHRLALNSIALGLATGVLGLALAWGLVASAARRPGRGAFMIRILSAWAEACPPLAFALGALMVPEVLRAAVDTMHSSPLLLSSSLRGLADGLDPYRTPGLLLVAVLIAQYLPALRRAAELGQERARPLLGDAARTLGASRRRAGRTLAAIWLGSAPGAAAVLTTALAATSLAPALILAPTSAARPVSPGILTLANEPGGLERAAFLAVAAIALNLTAFALASRRRAAPLGDWFRG